MKKYFHSSILVATLSLGLMFPSSAFLVSVGNDTAADHMALVGFDGNEIIIKIKGDNKPFRVISLPNGVSVFQVLEALESNPNIVYAEPNYPVEAFFVPNDTFYSFQWHLGQHPKADCR